LNHAVLFSGVADGSGRHERDHTRTVREKQLHDGIGHTFVSVRLVGERSNAAETSSESSAFG
jgi:hypothetical protein